MTSRSYSGTILVDLRFHPGNLRPEKPQPAGMFEQETGLETDFPQPLNARFSAYRHRDSRAPSRTPGKTEGNSSERRKDFAKAVHRGPPKPPLFAQATLFLAFTIRNLPAVSRAYPAKFELESARKS